MQSSNISSNTNTVHVHSPIMSSGNAASISVTQSKSANIEVGIENALPIQKNEQSESAVRKNANGQTGPKSIAGKQRSRFNALKSGRYAKSQLLPFEDA